MPLGRRVGAGVCVIGLAALGAATVAAASHAGAAADKTTIVLHTPRAKGDKVTITGTVTPTASTHHGKVFGEVTLYLVAKHSDQQMSSLTHPSSKGTFTLASVEGVAAGAHTFMVQYNPVSPWEVAQKTFRFTIRR